MREERLLADIARRVDTSHVARRMVEIFRAEIAAYRRLPESALNGQVLEISKLNVDTFFDSLVQGRIGFARRIFKHAGDPGRMRDAEGFPSRLGSRQERHGLGRLALDRE